CGGRKESTTRSGRPPPIFHADASAHCLSNMSSDISVFRAPGRQRDPRRRSVLGACFLRVVNFPAAIFLLELDRSLEFILTFIIVCLVPSDDRYQDTRG